MYFLIAFTLTLFLFVLGIPFLRRINFGQYVRILGPKKHYKKQGTPTMGGLYIIIGSLMSLIFLKIKMKMDIVIFIMIIMPIVLYGFIGFLDDLTKVLKKNNDGLSPKTKMLFQIIWAVVYFFLFISVSNTKINIFGYTIDLKWGYGILILLMFVSSSNAFNLCDGMDSLAGGLALIILCGLYYISKDEMINEVILIFMGSIFAFLCYNFFPAKVFMGDCGSLAIGATLANLCIILKCELLLMVFGMVLIIEALSVLIQVIYFKITNGKRLFLMAPLHHHFELKGYKETSIVLGFWFIELIFVILGVIIYKIYG